MEEKKNNNKWELILKIIIAVASAIAGALGATACKGML
ncbi:MAG: smalltalk protein [Bacteroides sp.]|nr:smalltalk protein [Bacteroides sp.]